MIYEGGEAEVGTALHGPAILRDALRGAAIMRPPIMGLPFSINAERFAPIVGLYFARFTLDM